MILEDNIRTGTENQKSLHEILRAKYNNELNNNANNHFNIHNKELDDQIINSIEDNIEIAEPETADSYSGQFKLRLPKTLHKILAEDSKKEGVSMNQYCVYLLAKNSEKEHISIAKKQSVLV